VRTLTNSAADTASAGDCSTVAKLDVQVRDLDADFHDTVFVRDAAIARSLPGALPPPPIQASSHE
jgi:hypothetical protein